jgi:hypothetical protein
MNKDDNSFPLPNAVFSNADLYVVVDLITSDVIEARIRISFLPRKQTIVSHISIYSQHQRKVGIPRTLDLLASNYKLYTENLLL